MLRVLLTGGAGFVGSHLADQLVARGHAVRVLDDLSTGSEENLALSLGSIGFRLGSVLDPALVDDLVRSADRVVHLAATVGVERVAEDPALCRRVIVDGTRHALAAAIRFDTPLLAVSSSEVYGFDPPAPVAEADVVARIPGAAPRLAYARAKLVADRMARATGASGRAVLAIRPFNVVGPRQGEDGGAVLPRFVERAVLGLPLEVHGNGSQRRTFLDVRDLAVMLADLVERDSWPFDAVNVGGTEEYSIDELAHLVVARLSSTSPVDHVDPPLARGGVEVSRRVPDLSRLGRLVDIPPLRPIGDAIAALAAECPTLVAAGL